MAKLALVYGLRLFPAEELEEVKAAPVALKGGRSAQITMHLLEGSKDEIEKQFHMSVEAFFEMYPEIS
ncbi:MAG TPA: allantoinase [Candidatus Binatia bacterium]|nr:allantoinase [Candidatus Binatia bacterium]